MAIINVFASTDMFLRIQHNDDSSLVEILDFKQLCDPFCREVLGRIHAGEELQDAALQAKADLIFPSGEALPRCWLDANYQSRMRPDLNDEAPRGLAGDH